MGDPRNYGGRALHLVPRFEGTGSDLLVDGRLWFVDIHPDKPWVLLTPHNGNSLQVWDYEIETRVAAFLMPDVGDAKEARFVPQKEWIVVRRQRSFHVYDMQGGKFSCVKVLRPPRSHGHAHGLAVHGSSCYVLTSFSDGTIISWDWKKNWSKTAFEGHSAAVTKLIFHPTDPHIFASASRDLTAKIWTAATVTAEMSPRQTLQDKDVDMERIRTMEFCAGLRKSLLITGHCGGAVRVWDYKKGSCVARFRGHAADVAAAFFHPRLPYIFTASRTGEIAVWSESRYELLSSHHSGMDVLESMISCRHSNFLFLGGKREFMIVKMTVRRDGNESESDAADGIETRTTSSRRIGDPKPVRPVNGRGPGHEDNFFTLDQQERSGEEEDDGEERAQRGSSSSEGGTRNEAAIGVEVTCDPPPPSAHRKKTERSAEDDPVQARIKFEKKIEEQVINVELKCMRALADLRSEHQRKESTQAERVHQLEAERVALEDRLEKLKLRIKELNPDEDLEQIDCSEEEVAAQEVVEICEYSTKEVQDATNNFDVERKISSSDHREDAYRGKLYDGTPVMVKRIEIGTTASGYGIHGAKFRTEVIDQLRRLQHPHLLKLLGVCYEENCLVFEDAENGSLKEWMMTGEKCGTRGCLSWQVRLRVMVEVARAVKYLHSTTKRMADAGPVIHRAIRPGTILLDKDFVAKVSGVDEALLASAVPPLPEDQTAGPTIRLVVGCDSQYVAPEYFRTGVFTEKTDIYAFGITVLEMLTGQWGDALGIIEDVAMEDDATFRNALDQDAGSWDVELAREVARLGLSCTTSDWRNRPATAVGILPVLEKVAGKATELADKATEIAHSSGDAEGEGTSPERGASKEVLADSPRDVDGNGRSLEEVACREDLAGSPRDMEGDGTSREEAAQRADFDESRADIDSEGKGTSREHIDCKEDSPMGDIITREVDWEDELTDSPADFEREGTSPEEAAQKPGLEDSLEDVLDEKGTSLEEVDCKEEVTDLPDTDVDGKGMGLEEEVDCGEKLMDSPADVEGEETSPEEVAHKAESEPGLKDSTETALCWLQWSEIMRSAAKLAFRVEIGHNNGVDGGSTTVNPSSLFVWISPPGRGRKSSNDGEKRLNNRSKLYRDKPWALNKVGGTNEAGWGAAVFLTEDEGTTWYCCGGIIMSEIDKATTEKGKVNERDLRKFFLTTVYDYQGNDWVKTDQKVSLDLALFKGYVQKAFAMKSFGGKGDGNAFRMLLPVEFLNRTNGYRKSGQYLTVGAGHQLTMPLVPFDATVEGLASLSTCSSDRRQVVSTPQQRSSGKDTLITYSRRSTGGSSGKPPERKEITRRPSKLLETSRAGASSRSRDTPQHEFDQESDEEMEEDDRARQLDAQFLATPGHIRGEGSCDVNVGREAGGGVETWLRDDGEDDEVEGECGSGEQREHIEGGATHCDGTAEHMEWERGAVSGGMGDDGLHGEEMEYEELEDEGGDVVVSAGLTSKGTGKRPAKASPTPAAPKKQARRKVVDEARVAFNALDASQGTLGEPNVKRKPSGRLRKTLQPKKAMRSSTRQKSDDSSDDAEGVAPRLLSIPDDDEQETKKPCAINMTQCYFLEYDEEGKKRRDPPTVVIDVMQILPIPEGDIVFNQRSLNLTIVAGLDAAIKTSTGPRGEDDPALWEPPELVLASIMPSQEHPDSQGTQVFPKDFDPDWADKCFYYPVVGQHTAEAIKRAVQRRSAAVDVFGFRNYDRVRIIYFDDDHTNGYVYVSTYDNTRGDVPIRRRGFLWSTITIASTSDSHPGARLLQDWHSGTASWETEPVPDAIPTSLRRMATEPVPDAIPPSLQDGPISILLSHDSHDYQAHCRSDIRNLVVSEPRNEIYYVLHQYCITDDGALNNSMMSIRKAYLSAYRDQPSEEGVITYMWPYDQPNGVGNLYYSSQGSATWTTTVDDSGRPLQGPTSVLDVFAYGVRFQSQSLVSDGSCLYSLDTEGGLLGIDPGIGLPFSAEVTPISRAYTALTPNDIMVVSTREGCNVFSAVGNAVHIHVVVPPCNYTFRELGAITYSEKSGQEPLGLALYDDGVKLTLYTGSMHGRLFRVPLSRSELRGCKGPPNTPIDVNLQAAPRTVIDQPAAPPTDIKRLAMILGGTGGGLILASIVATLIWARWGRKKPHSQARRQEGYSALPMLRLRPSRVEQFDLKTLSDCTDGFSETHQIGDSGAFGKVFRGLLDGKEVAIKVMTGELTAVKSNQFMAEVNTLSTVNHVNLIHLIGYCQEGSQCILVYPYFQGGFLHDRLFPNSDKLGGLPGDSRPPPLTLQERMSIAFQVAKGLAYLHDDAKPPIIHQDIKSNNILLGDVCGGTLHVVVADFGLAAMGERVLGTGHEQIVRTLHIGGTFGYMSPEYMLRGELSEKNDVYSFGVLALELLTGRKVVTRAPSGLGWQTLVEWVRPFLQGGVENARQLGSHMPHHPSAILDPCLWDQMARDSTEKMVKSAFRLAWECVHEEDKFRPAMRAIVQRIHSMFLDVGWDFLTRTMDMENLLATAEAEDDVPGKEDDHSQKSLDTYDVLLGIPWQAAVGERMHFDSCKVVLTLAHPKPQTIPMRLVVRAFLGLTSYYQRFIKGFAGVAKPLTNLLKKEEQLIWTPKCEAAFQALKEALTSAPVLARPDPTRPFALYNWQPQAISAVLTQHRVDGREHVIEYASKTLSQAQANYEACKGECLAVVWGIHHFRLYLYGQKFMLVTDHQPLLSLLNNADYTGTLGRWTTLPRRMNHRQQEHELLEHFQPPISDALLRNQFNDDRQLRFDIEQVNVSAPSVADLAVYSLLAQRVTYAGVYVYISPVPGQESTRVFIEFRAIQVATNFMHSIATFTGDLTVLPGHDQEPAYRFLRDYALQLPPADKDAWELHRALYSSVVLGMFTFFVEHEVHNVGEFRYVYYVIAKPKPERKEGTMALYPFGRIGTNRPGLLQLIHIELLSIVQVIAAEEEDLHLRLRTASAPCRAYNAAVIPDYLAREGESVVDFGHEDEPLRPPSSYPKSAALKAPRKRTVLKRRRSPSPKA
ncbi:hypothetical protein CBR_g37427 [Chara braunii]|uniref:non-specific serine/threonine protein kinase n=1 Tax=Chara braunii TaxID=69332 RepID=A0A388LN25_CHABU|nr:hypothetical protein CBR_g37427 [Chara braunii]|eukprot:GBG83623.1 hypothetical protein CBR_g37427 [Chara braunii]